MSDQQFAEQVYELVKLIPYGRVTTYGHIAKYLGTGKSARLVGWVLGKSQTAIIPAHRVVNSSGLLSGRHAFSKDYPMEERLREEGVEVKDSKVVNFKACLWDPALEL